MRLTAAEIARAVGGAVEGDGAVGIEGVAPIERAGSREITFLAEPRPAPEIASCRAGALLAAPGSGGGFPGTIIRVKDPALAMILATRALGLHRIDHPFRGVHPLAGVDPAARLGEGVSIGPHAVVAARATVGARSVLYPGSFVDADAVLGEECILYPGACVMRRCILGRRVVLNPGAIVGTDGFGFHPSPQGLVPVPQLGIVRLEDDVNVGAHSTVDRARFDETVLGRGVALDNHVHIGHNCVVGAHTAIAAHTGIAGGTKIGSGVLIGGHAGINGGIRIGDRARIAGKSGVVADVPAGASWYGYYAKDRHRMLREIAAMGQLPELLRRVRDLERRLEGR
jgi:UDP-3-O-[3-hydroxymyristoyl] glucosamine N-acyltransferase